MKTARSNSVFYTQRAFIFLPVIPLPGILFMQSYLFLPSVSLLFFCAFVFQKIDSLQYNYGFIVRLDFERNILVFQ